MFAGVYVVGRFVNIVKLNDVGVARELLQNRDFPQYVFSLISVGKSIENFFDCVFFAGWDVNYRNDNPVSSSANLFQELEIWT